MQIHGEPRPVDVTARRRADATARTRDAGSAEGASAGASAGASSSEGTADSFDPAAVSRFVAILKNMNPVDLHRVEELRTRIADGSYRADPEELASLFSRGQTPPDQSA